MTETIAPNRINSVVRGYVQAMLWANAVCNVESCEDGREIGECEHTLAAHSNFDVEDIDGGELAEIIAELTAFIAANLADFTLYCERREYSVTDGDVESHFGHDVALTRNGHGVGVWDRGLGDLGDRLADRMREMGSTYAHIGSDSVTMDS